MLPDSSIIHRPVTLDSSALLGSRRRELLAAADLHFYRGYWSSWIAEEVARVWTELVALRGAKDRVDRAEMKRRLERSRAKVNSFCAYCSEVLILVDYTAAQADLSWLRDHDDVPVVRTALAAGMPGVVVTEDKGFPLGSERAGILFLRVADFLGALYTAYPEAEAEIAEYRLLGNEGR